MNNPKAYIGPNDEVAELDSAWVLAAKRGRPPMPAPLRKQRVNIMLDADLLEKLRASGKGWQTRINAALRKEAGL
jgi:uncharacterized protein (DUF4415 family)